MKQMQEEHARNATAVMLDSNSFFCEKPVFTDAALMEKFKKTDQKIIINIDCNI